MDGFDQRTLAHPPRPPEQGIVGAMPARKLLRIGQQQVAHMVDSLEHGQRHAGNLWHRQHGAGLALPVIGIGLAQREAAAIVILAHGAGNGL